MISKGIRIDWGYSYEYIEIDLDHLDRVSEIQRTLEWWKKEGECLEYFTTSKCERRPDGVLEITIKYDRKNNPRLHQMDVCFGYSVMRVEKGKKSGRAFWNDADDKDCNGDAPWRSMELASGHKRESVSRLQRRQMKFRDELVELDERCALTGEGTLEALEAAHIRPASSGGNEIVENGLLLRSDLHRLFDAGKFKLGRDGRVQCVEPVSKYYSDLLRGKSIPPKTLGRVRAALEMVNQKR